MKTTANIKIITLTGKSINKYEKELLAFYDPNKTRSRQYLAAIKHSNIIVVALNGERIIGACRVISDMYMCAEIIDLLVDSEYRKIGIGSQIISKVVDVCTQKGIKNVNLVTDPSFPRLPEFYSKFGFENSAKNGVYMVLKKKD